MSAVLIVGGYAAMVWLFGWWGIAAAIVHIAILLAASGGRK